MVAALAAWRAVAISRRQREESAQFWMLERQSAAYVAAVREPMFSATDRFAVDAQALLRGAAADLDSLCASNAGVDEVNALVSEGLDAFNELFVQLRARLRRAATSWESPELTNRVGEIGESLQDEITVALAAYPRNRDPKALLEPVVDHVGRLEAEVISADPALVDADSTDLSALS